MRHVSFRRPDGSAGFGRLEGEEIVQLDSPAVPTLRAALEAGGLEGLPEWGRVALSDVTLLPPVTDPGKIFCVGLNYADHIKEMGRAEVGYPAIFVRWADSLVAHGQAIIRPPESEKFDYEGELAVVIGKAGRRIPAERAMDHVAGFSIVMDGSIRDWQRHNVQFTPGKNFTASGGFGPALVSPDEVGPLGEQRVQTRLNGQLVQDQAVSDMLFDVPAIIAYLSTFTELRPGDVIATGTPSGVGAGREPPLFMKGGDLLEVTIDRVGTLTLPVVDEA